MLAAHYRTRLASAWPDAAHATTGTDVLVALHARRSAGSVLAWSQQCTNQPLVLALTGTDLYRDIHQDATAQRSLSLAQRLIVLQEQGVGELPAACQGKARVVFQSSPSRQPLPKTQRHLRAVMVGHLRDEKWPQTLFEAARLIDPEDGILIDHIGVALDPALGLEAERCMRACAHYRWLGGVSHHAARARIQRAHVLVHTSRMEGGAHVIMEAVVSGTPVLASRVSGNVGMLGVDYAGYFEAGNAAELAARLRSLRLDQSDQHGGWTQLRWQCAQRAPLFAPQAEQAGLLAVLNEICV